MRTGTRRSRRDESLSPRVLLSGRSGPVAPSRACGGASAAAPGRSTGATATTAGTATSTRRPQPRSRRCSRRSTEISPGSSGADRPAGSESDQRHASVDPAAAHPGSPTARPPVSLCSYPASFAAISNVLGMLRSRCSNWGFLDNERVDGLAERRAAVIPAELRQRRVRLGGRSRCVWLGPRAASAI